MDVISDFLNTDLRDGPRSTEAVGPPGIAPIVGNAGKIDDGIGEREPGAAEVHVPKLIISFSALFAADRQPWGAVSSPWLRSTVC